MTLFIAGTDTGVGKTLVTALVTLKLQQQGLRAVALKPIASGYDFPIDNPLSDDAAFLKLATGSEEPLENITPLRFAEPLAPLVAARRAGESSANVMLETASLIGAMKARYDAVVVEGVGGLLAPIGESETVWTNVEMAALCDHTIIVARRTLGTINHTAMTARIAKVAGLQVRGLIFCDACPVEPDDIAAQTSAAICAEMTGLPILAEVPYLSSLESDELRAIASDWPAL